jgi:hypothetical protein
LEDGSLIDLITELALASVGLDDIPEAVTDITVVPDSESRFDEFDWRY